ncbi:MAG: hypothetical protein FJ318_07825 [SAR202 cluster bacterium]|nr:hypothetical protein [SAR202 cluster bacterium]
MSSPPLKPAIHSTLLEIARSFPGLLTYAPVGSHADATAPEELHNDYDFVVVFDELPWGHYEAFASRLADAARRLSRPDHLVYVEPRLGPIKPRGDTPTVSMLQPLIFTRRLMRDYIANAPFLTLAWSRYPTAFGLRLTAYDAIGFPTVAQLLDARAGIRHYRQMARENAVIVLTPVNQDGHFARKREPYPVTEDLLLELYHSIVLRTMTNALMVFAHDASETKRQELIDAFLRRFPQLEQHRRLAEDLSRNQALAREGKPVACDLPAMREQAMAFLDDLEAVCLDDPRR